MYEFEIHAPHLPLTPYILLLLLLANTKELAITTVAPKLKPEEQKAILSYVSIIMDRPRLHKRVTLLLPRNKK